MKRLMLVCSVVFGLTASVLADTRTVDDVEYVYLLKSGAWKDAKADGSYWSDGEVPGSGKNYLVADELSLTFNVQDDTFTGDSLRIGAPGNPGHMPISARTTIPVLVCSSGWIDNDGAFTITGTKMSILSKADAPFLIRGDTGSGYWRQSKLMTRIEGAADAVFELRSKDPTKQGGAAMIYLATLDNYKPEGNPMNGYFGKIVVDGKGVRFSLEWHSSTGIGDGVLGADPGYPVPDAITLRNEGELYIRGAHSFKILTPNRGVTVEATGGRIRTDGGYKSFLFPIVGGGPLFINTNNNKVQFENSALKIASLTCENNSQVYVGEHSAGWSDIDVVLLSGTLVTPSVGFFPKSLDYQGVTIKAGVANGAEVINNIMRPIGDGVGVLGCSAASVIAATPIALDVEADLLTVVGGRYELLRLPTSVKELTLADISVADREVAIETTADGIQHVYAGFKANICAYVVPPGTPGVVPTAPYASWATAATNFTDAIGAATEGGCIHVKPGTYYIYDTETAHTVNLNKKLRIISDDGTGKLATDRTILDGQSKTRLIKSTATACCIEGFTFRNAQADGKGAAVQMNRSNSAQIVVRNCVFEDNVSANGTGVLSLDDTYSRARIEDCVFRWNTCWNTSNDGAGAIYINSAAPGAGFGQSPYVKDCVFVDNLGTYGAIRCGTTWIEDCHFTNNYGRATVNNAISKSNNRVGAGAVSGSAVITNCTFVGNDGDVAAVNDAGRMVDCLVESNAGVVLHATPYGTLSNVLVTERCRFLGNRVERIKRNTSRFGWYRGCLFVNNVFTGDLANFHSGYGGGLGFENCTIVSNAMGQIASGGATNALWGIFMTNTVFALNSVKSHPALPGGDGATFVGGFNFTDDETIAGMTTEGLVSGVAPRFTDAGNGDYRLKPGSPLREKALPLAWMAGTTDLDGNPRVLDRHGKVSAAGLPDIGCYECALPMPGLILILR